MPTTSDLLRDASRTADVLVLGGGLAGAWAALGAARAGAQVVLVDKGHCGTSGVTSTAGPGHWWVPPDPALRREAIARRAEAGEGLADPRWMARVLDLTWRNLPTLAPNYRFGIDAQGRTQYRGLRGPEYLRALREQVEAAGVRILDHHPALELLRHDDGSVAGAAGLRRRDGQAWSVRAGAVVVATGGCAFLSKLLGADHDTGDGLLMAAEAGAELSGMEFTNYYTVAPVFSSMTRSMSYVFARYLDAAGQEIEVPQGPAGIAALGRALLRGRVYCTLDRMPADIREMLPRISPNVLLVFRRRGIDPFRERFEVTLRGEGTVRGIGGLRIANDDCETTVEGLYAAGDAATRELVAGAISGGGAQNSAWALSSGLIAGEAAARRARESGIRHRSPVQALGRAGLRPSGTPAPLDTARLVAGFQQPMLDLDLNMFRQGGRLLHSLGQLDSLWHSVRRLARALDGDVLRTREIAAMLAVARWSTGAALARRETRGMHWRDDAPQANPALAHRTTVGGLDQVWVRPEPVAPRAALAA